MKHFWLTRENFDDESRKAGTKIGLWYGEPEFDEKTQSFHAVEKTGWFLGYFYDEQLCGYALENLAIGEKTAIVFFIMSIDEFQLEDI